MSETSRYALTGSEQASYDASGFLVREGLWSADEVAVLRQAATAAEQLARERSQTGKTYFLDNKRFVDIGHLTVQYEHLPETELVRVIEPVHELSEEFDQLLDDERLVAPMQSILGQQELSLWTAKLNLKPPHCGSGFGWHQDSPYWIHDSDHVDLLPNVMVTFDDATIENGCFQVIRESHLKGCLPGTSDGSQLGGFFTDPNCFSPKDAVPMVVPAGSAIFFSPHSVHGSGPNLSGQPRRAIILTYQPAGHVALKSGVERPIRGSKSAATK